MSAKRILEGGMEKMSPLLRLQKLWGLTSSDSEDDTDGKENAGPKGTLKRSGTRTKPNKKRKIKNGLRKEFKNEPRPSKKLKLNKTSGSGEEAGPSEMWKCEEGADPLKIKLTRVNPPNGEKEKQQRPDEEEPMDFGWLFDDIFDLPDGNQVPDLNLLFPEENQEA
ncbi:hypothetical protein V5799_026807 [Amblyomma americanum]|uniref:Uncharacterized protein n=1 Tax=Amblyomma americanum TaxID=6943 RepID=A0AAQ4DHI8_AMBAM